MAITTRSGNILPGPSIGKSIDGEVVVNESEKSNPVKSEKRNGIDIPSDNQQVDKLKKGKEKKKNRG